MFCGTIALTLFSTIVKDEHANLTIETDVEDENLILVPLKKLLSLLPLYQVLLL
jgi:hypothetical protein